MTENQTAKKRRRVNGDGSVYKRGDGDWVGAFDVPTTSGARKRVVVYGKTLADAREKLAKVQQDVRSGIPVPGKVWKLGPYLDDWLENFVKRNRRPATTPGPLPRRHGLGLAGNRARVHHAHRSAGRTAQLRPVLPAHLRRQQDPAHQGPPRPAHGRLTA